jgi:hypothetical protein
MHPWKHILLSIAPARNWLGGINILLGDVLYSAHLRATPPVVIALVLGMGVTVLVSDLRSRRQ